MRLSSRVYHKLTEFEKEHILKRNDKFTMQIMKIINELNDEIRKERNKIINKQKERTIEYRFIPREILESQFNQINLEQSFSDLFSTPLASIPNNNNTNENDSIQ